MKETIHHFALAIWNDLIRNRNGAGFKRNLKFMIEDIRWATGNN